MHFPFSQNLLRNFVLYECANKGCDPVKKIINKVITLIHQEGKDTKEVRNEPLKSATKAPLYFFQFFFVLT